LETEISSEITKTGYMKISKHAVTLAFASLFLSFSTAIQAEPLTFLKSIESSDLTSYIPLVIFAVSAVMVYLCNRPRVMVCARARRRTEQSRSEEARS
jgi:hypothetical protein